MPKNLIALSSMLLMAFGATWAVHRFHKPGQLDVISAQAMDMSAMRPPTGAAPVALAAVRRGRIGDVVTYTGSVQAYNEQDISPRITGTLLSLPVYPGDAVHAGQTIAQLDTAEVGARARQAAQEAQAAQQAARVAEINHTLHHQAALDQASAQTQAAQQGVFDARAEAQVQQDATAEAQANVQSARANADYWKTEIGREKQLADAGAVSQQEYQNETAKAQAAFAALAQARAKVREATAMARAARARLAQARQQVIAARAGQRAAEADLAVAGGQALQAGSGASAAQAAARAAAVVQSYARMTSPADGVVTERPVAPGTLVQPGQVILRIAEIDRVRVQAHVAVNDLAGIRAGSPAAITVPGNEGLAPLAARVTSVFPAADNQTRTAVVEAVVPNPTHRLLPGAFVTVRITKAGLSDKLLVPASALTYQGGQAFVWVAQGAPAAGRAYECVICHIHYTAAQARKFHYRDPMEGGKLVPVMSGAAAAGGRLTAHQVAVQTGAGDGTWTSVTSGGLADGLRVVTHGQAGLTEGARVIPVAWDANGPKTLPTAAQANRGQTVYRCEKCGMTYSAADAIKNRFVDPMDGGKLVPAQTR